MKPCFPIIHQGGYLGLLFKPSTRGSRTFGYFLSRCLLGVGEAAATTQPPHPSFTLPRAEGNYQEEKKRLLATY